MVASARSGKPDSAEFLSRAGRQVGRIATIYNKPPFGVAGELSHLGRGVLGGVGADGLDWLPPRPEFTGGAPGHASRFRGTQRSSGGTWLDDHGGGWQRAFLGYHAPRPFHLFAA